MNFSDRLIDAITKKNNAVCVGLDPRLSNLPKEIQAFVDDSNAQIVADGYEIFCKEIIDVVAPLVPIVKPQSAFFEILGAAGISSLAKIVAYARSKGVMVILDAKRGDIGTTAVAYAHAYLSNESSLGCDALTVNPYMGVDTLQPFVKAANENENGIFVLVKTSNSGSGHFQDRTVLVEDATNQVTDPSRSTLYELVGLEVNRLANDSIGTNGYGSVGAVVGATYPAQLSELRAQMPNTFFLIPGYGAQGGGIEDVKPGFDSNGLGGIVNSSRGIIFAYDSAEFQSDSGWQASVEAACLKMVNELSLDNLKS